MEKERYLYITRLGEGLKIAYDIERMEDLTIFVPDQNLVVIINNDDRLSNDVEKAASAFRSMNYIVQRLGGINDFIKPSTLINNLVVIILGFSYGYRWGDNDDRIFLDKNRNESVTYADICRFFSVEGVNARNTVIFLETSRARKHSQTIFRWRPENNPFQVCMIKLTFFIKKSTSVLLKLFLEFQKGKERVDIDQFCRFLGKKLDESYSCYDYECLNIEHNSVRPYVL